MIAMVISLSLFDSDGCVVGETNVEKRRKKESTNKERKISTLGTSIARATKAEISEEWGNRNFAYARRTAFVCNYCAACIKRGLPFIQQKEGAQLPPKR